MKSLLSNAVKQSYVTYAKQGINMKHRLNTGQMTFSDVRWILDEGAFPALAGESFDKLPASALRPETGRQQRKFDLRELERLLSEPEENIEIKKTDFYRNEQEKNRQNWFAYELAIKLHEVYQKDLLNKFRKNGSIDKRKLAEFAIFYTKEMAETLLDNLQNNQKEITLKNEVMEKFFGNRNKKLIELLATVSEKQILLQMEKCRTCPSRCFQLRKQYCPDFE